MVKRPIPLGRLAGNLKVGVPNPVPVVGSGPQYTCVPLNNDFTQANGFFWFAQCDPAPVGYCPVSYRNTDEGTIIRIETRPGATWTEDVGRGVERAEVDGSDSPQRWETADEWECDFYFTLTTGVANAGSDWMSIAQVKNSTTGPNGEPNAFFISPALILSVIDEELGIEIRSTTDTNPGDTIPSPTLIWSDDVQRGHRYHIQLAGRFDPLGVDSYLVATVDGVEVFNDTAFPFGYYNEYNYFKLGLYRDAGTTIQTAEYENFTYLVTPPPIVPGAEAQAYIDEQPSPPSMGYERMIAKFINGLADASLFDKGIAGYICGVEGEAGALVNLFDPTGVVATVDGVVTHNAPLGWKSTGGTINTGIGAETLTGRWDKNSGCMAIIIMDAEAGDDDQPQMGDRFFTNTVWRGDHNAKFRLNCETNGFPDNQGEQAGIMIVNRVEANNARVLFGPGTMAETVANVTTDLWNDNPDNWFLICGASADWSPSAVGAAFWFEGLTPTEETALQGLLLDLSSDLNELL